jgi:alpha-galactosidase
MQCVRHGSVASGLMAVLLISGAITAAEKPKLKVFILAGQSNMEGKAKMSLLEHQVKDAKTRDLFKHLQNDKGEWIVRDDVWIKFLDRHGGLTVGYGSPNCIGPELALGNTVGDHFDEPVLLIKTAWGGRSLFRDFRSPSSGLPADDVLQKELEQARKNKPQTSLDEVKARYGASYREMLKEINDSLANLKTLFPQYEDQGYELAGFVWFQGWNDMINAEYTAAYTQNMANFIRDVRKDLKSPELPFVIGVLGVGGEEEKPEPQKEAFKKAQAAAGELEEFKGNVAVVHTAPLWDKEADAVFKKGWREHIDEWNTVGSDWPFHYLGSAKCYSRIGNAFAEAVIKLQKPAP